MNQEELKQLFTCVDDIIKREKKSDNDIIECISLFNKILEQIALQIEVLRQTVNFSYTSLRNHQPHTLGGRVKTW
jgi:hypothetical protein